MLGAMPARPLAYLAALALVLPGPARAHVPHDLVTAVAPAPGLDPDTTWWLVADHDEVSDLYRSDDGGITWQATHGDCLRDLLLDAATLDDGSVVLLGDERTWWSDGDGGWQPLELGFQPTAMAGGDRLWLGANDGVWSQDADGSLDLRWEFGPVASLHEGADGAVVAITTDGVVAWQRDGTWGWADGPTGTLSATADAEDIWVGCADGTVQRWELGAWQACAPSPYLDHNPVRAQVVALASDGTTLALAHADIGPALSTDACDSWEEAAAPLEINWPEDVTDDGYRCWTTLDGAFTGLAVGGERAMVAGYDGPATMDAGTWYHPPLKGGDYTRGVGFSTDFMGDGTALAAVYGCGIARTTDGGASWTCAPEGIAMPAAQDLDVAPDANFLNPAYTLSDRSPMRSNDGGQSWTALEGPWRKVWVLSPGLGGRLWAANVHPEDDEDLPMGSALFSPDYGETWSEVGAFDVVEDWVIVGILDRGETVVAWTGMLDPTTALNGVFLSEDGGESFALDHQVDGGIKDVCVWPDQDPTRIVAAGPAGIQVRIDGAWQQASLPDEVGVRRVVTASDGTLIAATWTQRLLRSDDGGESWEDVGAQIEGQIEDLAVHPDFERYQHVIASGPAGSFIINAVGGVNRWLGLQRVDDDTEYMTCGPDCTQEEREGAGFGLVTRLAPGCAAEAWVRGTTVRVVGEVDSPSSIELWVDGVLLQSQDLGTYPTGATLAEVDDLEPGQHRVTLTVTDGDGVCVDAMEGREFSAPLTWGNEDTGWEPGPSDGSWPPHCGCSSGASQPGWLLAFLALARRRRRD
jgi:hypothetical protein